MEKGREGHWKTASDSKRWWFLYIFSADKVFCCHYFPCYLKSFLSFEKYHVYFSFWFSISSRSPEYQSWNLWPGIKEFLAEGKCSNLIKLFEYRKKEPGKINLGTARSKGGAKEKIYEKGAINRYNFYQFIPQILQGRNHTCVWLTPIRKWPHSYWKTHENPTFLWLKPVHKMGKSVILSAFSTDLIVTYLEAMGSNQSFFSSPNTCWRFFTKPRLNPFLSGPFWNTGAEKASAKRGNFSEKKWKSMPNTLKQGCTSCSLLKTKWFNRL